MYTNDLEQEQLEYINYKYCAIELKYQFNVFFSHLFLMSFPNVPVPWHIHYCGYKLDFKRLFRYDLNIYNMFFIKLLFLCGDVYHYILSKNYVTQEKTLE